MRGGWSGVVVRPNGGLDADCSQVGVSAESDVEMSAELGHIGLGSVGKNERFGRWKVREVVGEKDGVS